MLLYNSFEALLIFFYHNVCCLHKTAFLFNLKALRLPRLVMFGGRTEVERVRAENKKDAGGSRSLALHNLQHRNMSGQRFITGPLFSWHRRRYFARTYFEQASYFFTTYSDGV